MASPSADEEANVPLGCGECILPSDFIGYFPYAKPWCWNMNPNICPCPKSPSFVGKYTSTMVRIWVIFDDDGWFDDGLNIPWYHIWLI